MSYNFDERVSRHNTNCYKWDVDSPEQDVIPLWVADMDFKVAPRIVDALHARVAHGIFGYTKVPQSFYDAIVGWYSRRYGCRVAPESIIYTSGVVPAVSAIIKAIAGDQGCGVLMQTPAYNCFFSSIANNKCHIVENKLIQDGDTYNIDFDDFEAKAKLPDTRIFLLCSPHNPVGRIWTADELRRMADICLANDVVIVADEIHSGIIMPGHAFTPFGAIGDKYQDGCVITASCSKSFNTAGLQISYIIARDGKLRRAVDKAINVNEVCDVNPFGVIALQVAFNECEDWLSEMCAYVWANFEFLSTFLAERLPSVRLTRLQATYLAWLDCRAFGLSSQELGETLLRDAKVRVSPGNIYGAPDGFIRLNLACPRAQLAEGLERMAHCLESRNLR